jgi:hypothetical protein
MHTDQATQMINKKTDQLDKLNAFMTDEEDKPAIIQRIAELKALVDSSPAAVSHSPPLTPP